MPSEGSISTSVRCPPDEFIILGSSAVLAGTFFVNWAVDHRVIWQTPTEASLRAAVDYYHDALEGPQWLAAGVAGLTGLSILAILLKLSKGTTSRVLFDGGSLLLYSAAIFIYSQNVHTSFAVLAALPRGSAALSNKAFGAISQIASAHAIIAVTLTGVVALQGAQYYSERQIQKEVKRELKKIGIAPSSAGTPVPGSPVKASSTTSSQTLQARVDAKQQDLRRSPRKK